MAGVGVLVLLMVVGDSCGCVGVLDGAWLAAGVLVLVLVVGGKCVGVCDGDRGSLLTEGVVCIV